MLKKRRRETAYLRITRWIRANPDIGVRKNVLPVVSRMRKEASSGRGGGNGSSGVEISSTRFGEINSENCKTTKEEEEENNKKLNPD